MNDQTCQIFHFGLIVTGKSERAHLPKLFKSLMATGFCAFQVISFIGQRAPITSQKRKLKMIGTGKTIPDKDVADIGLPARRYLSSNFCNFVLVIDDLEQDRKQDAQQVFDRYRLALDTILTDGQSKRAAVHFLVNMLETYYFADAQAINAALNLNPQIRDYTGDVEDIPNPKSELKKLYSDFHEIRDGGNILDFLNIEHVLSRPDTCAWLRGLFAWCIKILRRNPQCVISPDQYRLDDGRVSAITGSQINHL